MMSKKDKDLLERHRAHLIRDISLEDGMLLAHLRARGAITGPQEEFIKAVHNKTNQAQCLLDTLQRGDRDTMDKLVYSLRETGQTLVVDGWLRLPGQPDTWGPSDGTGSVGASSAIPLSESDKFLLERSRPDMMQRLSLADGQVLGQLRARGTLTNTEENHIKTLQKSSGNSNAVGQLINVILRKSSDSMEALLHTLNQTGHSHIVSGLRQPTTKDTFAQTFIKGGSSTTELEEALRDNLKAKLDVWRTVLEGGVCDQNGHPYYIEQPCTYTERGTRSEVQSEVSSVISIVEESCPGDRIIVYGEAGTGKTTLLKQIARSWIEKSNDRPALASKFKFVFFILMREIDDRPLLETICNKLKLIPASSRKDLKKSLELNAKKTIFLLDSYEEMRHGVVNTEIDDLIFKRNRSRFSESTVVVTSRPGSKLSQTGHEKTARLEDIPAGEVERILRRYLDGNEEAVEVLRSFRKKTFLQRPFNLALFLYVVQKYKRAADMIGFTQVELLNQFLQYLMLAYARKQGFKEFIPQPGSYLQNKDNIPGHVIRLFRDIAKTCYEERKQKNVILHVRDAKELTDYLSFGLFTSGEDDLSVLLPHPLFQEYFAAAHLAQDPKAWNAFFEEIKAYSLFESPRRQRRLLSEVLESLGMENVVKMAVALAPEELYEWRDNTRVTIRQVDNICSQLGSLFVVGRWMVRDYPDQSLSCACRYYHHFDVRRCLLSDYPGQCQPVACDYYNQLLRECRCESGRRILASAFVNAQQVSRNYVAHCVGQLSEGVLPYLTYNQCVTLLKRMYNLVLTVKGRQLLLSPADGGKTVVIRDRFVLALVYLRDCTINAEKLVFAELALPAMILSRNTTAVDHLILYDCTLHVGASFYRPELEKTAKSSQHPASSSPIRIELHDVVGLEQCRTIIQRTCRLKLIHHKRFCRFTIRTLNTWFPKLSELESPDLTLVYVTEDELMAWLEHVNLSHTGDDQMFFFAPQCKGMPLALCRSLNTLATKGELRRKGMPLALCRSLNTLALATKGELRRVEFASCLFLMDVTHSFNSIGHTSLSELSLRDCHGGINVYHLLEVCNWCVSLRKVSLYQSDFNSRRNVRSIRETVQQNNTLGTLEVMDCGGDLVQLLGFCSLCTKLWNVELYSCSFELDEKDFKLVQPQPGLTFDFTFYESAFCNKSGNMAEDKSGDIVELDIIQHLERLFPSAYVREGQGVAFATCMVRRLLYQAM